MSDFGPETFNRVISVELFEHMKNYQLPLTRVAKALKPQGKLFIHIFARKGSQYDFEDGWMGTHSFTGGTMPSTDRCISFKATSPWSNSGRFLVSIMREPARISLRRWTPARKRFGRLWKRHKGEYGNAVLSLAHLLYGSHIRGAIHGVYATISS